MEWKYHQPEFLCDQVNHDLLCYSPWSGHRNFAYDLIVYMRPQLVVELGSYYGCSFFAFLQAIWDYSLETKLIGIDTWSGDKFTEHDYEQDIYEAFLETLNMYKNSNAHPFRMTFDEANCKFEDGSIDLLHIDGSHHYDDVKHDFEIWLPKMKTNGVILFHDVSETIVYDEKMGSPRFWKEIKERHPYTLEFDHSSGLGIYFQSNDLFVFFQQNVDLTKYQQINNYLDLCNKDELRKNHFTIIQNDKHIDFLKQQIDIKDLHFTTYQATIEGKDNYIKELEKRLGETAATHQATLEGKDSYIKELGKRLGETVAAYQATIEDKDLYIMELMIQQAKLSKKNEELGKLYDRTLEQRLKRIFGGEKQTKD